jgi:two-component system sensor histidine kinase AtoS
MEEVVNNLLRFSKPEPYQFKEDDINKIVNESVSLIRPQINKKNIMLKIHADKNIPFIKVDSHHLRDAFVNLIINAIQAVTQNGKIDILIQRLNFDQKSENKNFQGNDVIKVESSDDGTGISDEIKENIFDPFYTTKLNGTGLGLAIVKRTIEDHDGFVQILNNPQKGVNVQIYLPISGMI